MTAPRLVYDPRIKKNVPLDESTNPALVLLDILMRMRCPCRELALEEVMVKCSELANICDRKGEEEK